MIKKITCVVVFAATLLVGIQAAAFSYKKDNVDVGPRPEFLVKGMTDGPLKTQLLSCANGPFYKTDFSIGHRGAPLQFPEHTKESYEAAARMGAGILECDVTFTEDGELVCRHAQCDLHRTTDIVLTELNNKCTVPWDENNPNPRDVRCCASDLTLDEFKTLNGKMDAADYSATTAAEFVGGTADWRTDLYNSRGTLMSHAESIDLFKSLGVKFTPELKGPDRNARVQVETVFGSQEAYAQKLIDEYKEAYVWPYKVFPQSFNAEDVAYWIEAEPQFGRQAVYLDGRYSVGVNPKDPSTFVPSMQEIADSGVNIIAPPMFMLLDVNDEGEIIPSPYANEAKAAGLEIITWTFERTDLRNGSRRTDDPGSAGFYYLFDTNPLAQAIKTDGDKFLALDVLAKDVGIKGIFSDWPATVTYYDNCMNHPYRKYYYFKRYGW